MDYPLTLVGILKRAGKLFGKVEIVSCLPDATLHRYTYTDFTRRVRALAEAVQKAGLKRGDRVGTLMWNHYVHLESYFGIPMAGGVLHTLNLRLHPTELAYIVNHSGDRFLIVDDTLLPLYERFQDQIKLDRVIVVSSGEKTGAGGYEDYEALLGGARGDFTYPDLRESEPAGMCYTSGTTGRPKGVMYSHRSFVLGALVLGLADSLAIRQEDVVLSVVPLFHAAAWGVPFAATMLGAKQVFVSSNLRPEDLLDRFETEQVTLSCGVPTVWFSVLEALEKHPGRWNLSEGFRLGVAGAPPQEAMIRRFDRQGIQVIHGWGMTEIAPLSTTSRLKPHMKAWSEEDKYAVLAKQGLPGPLLELRAMGEEGEAPWDGKAIGELQARGPWVADSYFNLPESRERWTDDGWFSTGDIVTIDSEGYIKIRDRTQELIRSGGEWISSVELENTLMAHPAVREVAVVAVPHPKWQERPLAVVVPNGDARPSTEEFRAFLSSKFSKWKIPDAFVFVDEIPLTSTGKFKKRELRERFKNWREEQ